MQTRGIPVWKNLLQLHYMQEFLVYYHSHKPHCMKLNPRVSDWNKIWSMSHDLTVTTIPCFRHEGKTEDVPHLVIFLDIPSPITTSISWELSTRPFYGHCCLSFKITKLRSFPVFPSYLKQIRHNQKEKKQGLVFIVSFCFKQVSHTFSKPSLFNTCIMDAWLKYQSEDEVRYEFSKCLHVKRTLFFDSVIARKQISTLRTKKFR